MSKYSDFWNWFNANENRFFDTIEKDAEYWVPIIDDKLKAIHPDIVFEISELLGNYREFIISADGDLELFEDVFTLCDEALVSNRWEIIALRQPEGVTSHHVELDGLVLGYENIFYHLEQDNIRIFIEGYNHEDQRYVHAYFLLLDALIGEYDAVTRIASTTILKKKETSLKPFIDLIKDIKKESTNS